MFLRFAARETYVAEANIAFWKQGNVSESSQKHFGFTHAIFASETHVSQFSHPRKQVSWPLHMHHQWDIAVTLNQRPLPSEDDVELSSAAALRV